MITITCNYKGKIYEYKYQGEIVITIGETMLGIDWFLDEQPPSNDSDELDTWCSNGFDSFEIKDIISIEGT